MQRYSEAAREFQQALIFNPRLVEARYYLAVVDFNERRYADARQQFDKLKDSGYDAEREFKKSGELHVYYIRARARTRS
jgi:cytochrome c-type biogenesis protein CcmH/NrfG